MGQTMKNGIMVIDTTTVTLETKAKIQAIVWSGIGTSGDDLVLTDYAGTTTIFSGKGIANDNLVINFPDGLMVTGIKATTLDSGNVHIYESSKKGR
jgi:hypothetical protein